MDYTPTYQYYTDVYKGQMKEEEFNAVLPRALAMVNYLVGCKEVNEFNCDGYRRAICSVTGVYDQCGSGELTGFTIGSFSVSPVGATKTADQLAYEAASKELFPCGLMYQGF